MAVTTDVSLCSRSVLNTFTVRATKQHPVNISFSSTGTSVLVFYRVDKSRVLVLVRVISASALVI